MMYGVMYDRAANDATDYLIWTTWTLLALLIGVGASFLAWTEFPRVADFRLAFAAVSFLGLGTVLIALSIERPLLRAFLYVAAIMFVFCYALGPNAFAQFLS
jgi:hypothetical protein